MQDKNWYSILGLDAEPLFLQDHMLNHIFIRNKTLPFSSNLTTHITINPDDDWKIPDDRETTTFKPKTIIYPTQIPIQHIVEKSPFYLGRLKEHLAPHFYQYFPREIFTSSNFYLLVFGASVIVVFSKSSGQDLALALFNRILEIVSGFFTTLQKAF